MGWLGLSPLVRWLLGWGLHHAVQAGSAVPLSFLDADTEPAPQCLERLAASHGQLGGLVSLLLFLGVLRLAILNLERCEVEWKGRQFRTA